MLSLTCVGNISNVNLELIQRHAATITGASPIEYVKTASLHGALFSDVDDGAVSSVDTDFYFDHAEPKPVLSSIRRRGIDWPFGHLAEGHEFLVVVKPQPRIQSDGTHSSDF